MKLHRTTTLLAATAFTVSAAIAQETSSLEEWFEALRTSDRQKISELLSSDAEIVLNDIGVVQTKQEFLASLDAWEDAAGDDTEIRYRLDEENGKSLMVTVCYDFPGNSVLTSEQFQIENHRIKRSEQSQIAENCDGFER
ncbi:DUF4440 domain-containing protein [Nitratireductor sp. GISD-1A_MAKvit]|uniref:nuclear transport factor 2 family protein n=1 Tax=Nitratireductor sp. GISD-1A_MAKvit TaxID=3234198 RepID=UPI003467109F